jgi:CubicO group peptidase (beta-lactamase class C family)
MKKIFITLAIIIFVFGILYMVLPYYIPRALIYNFVGIDDYPLFYNRVVKAGKSHPWKILEFSKRKTLSEASISNLEEFKTVAFLVIKDSTIIEERYWSGYDTIPYSNSFSMAKSIIGLLVGFAYEEGKIKSLDQKVSDFLPDFEASQKTGLTVKHLLTMSADLNWDETYSSLTSVTTQAYYGNDLVKLLSGIGVVSNPGIKFNYQSGSTQLLAFIVEKATGKTISDYASEKLWIPLGAEHDALWCLDQKDGHEKAYCCFNSNARDFARFGQLILNKGKTIDKQLISEDYITRSITPDTNLISKGKQVDFYGYQWWIMYHKGLTIPYMRGLNGQYVFVIPSLHAIVVRLGNKRSREIVGNAPKDTYLWLDAALEVLN